MSAPSASTKKKAKKAAKKSQGGSNVFDQFSQKQVAEFKEGFQMMDKDKDGIIGRSDIRQTADEVGRNFSDNEIDSMLADCSAPINFTQLINMFGQRQQGGAADEDEVIIAAFKAFSNDKGKIEVDNLKTAMLTFGEKYTPKEFNDFLENVEVEDGHFDCEYVCNMLTGKLPDD